MMHEIKQVINIETLIVPRVCGQGSNTQQGVPIPNTPEPVVINPPTPAPVVIQPVSQNKGGALPKYAVNSGLAIMMILIAIMLV